MIDPIAIARDLIKILNPERIRYKPYKTTALSKYRSIDEENSSKVIIYRIQLPDENHAQNYALTILYNRESINEFLKYVISTIMMTYGQLLAHNREVEYKATQYYITYRLQTELQKVNGRNYPILIPTVVVSTIKAKNYIKTISYNQSEDIFVEKYLDQVFSEAIQVRGDNKFSDEVPQRYEVPIIRFYCLKSAVMLIVMNFKSNKYEIIERPGPKSCSIHIIVKSTENFIHLKFIDAKNYISADMDHRQQNQ
ncbi:MAG: hypothetical protein EZS28_000657 [Streblomastix strix]|uniref:Uncharacterized protein n=1 Tax=Streblomastix strix TaxID=222440 RepID=A0A5J4XA94_9EUKA|nr:MAG: hypothetical protein EZS28_000657 [Streblomastix strix]